ncbi:alpha/beta hydrolase family protein [Euzebya rosea]|uniref:alpha/beta hydrolase family protein n=1 Tax=Euzebya rosea TaxID=2052804 RepID=UPI00196B5060|nr:S9 family peptidase [Euzebya rosea]
MPDTDRTVAPYGTWPSPLSAADLAAASVGYNDLAVDGEDVLWLQSDPTDGGRVAVVRSGADGREVLSPAGFNARTRVGEYGGGALGAGHGVVLACSWEDQRVHRIADGDAVPVTPEPATPAGIRWAGMAVLPGGEAFLAIRETHGPDRPRSNVNVHGAEEAINEIVHVDISSGRTTVLVTGPDFVGGPFVNAAGTRVAWLQWDHPDMPWDAAELWVADMMADDGPALGDAVHVAGGDGSAVADACWDGDRLLFSDDPDGWWNVFAWSDGPVERLQEEAVDSGAPRWVHGIGQITVADGAIHVQTLSDGYAHARRIDGTGSGTALHIDGVGLVGSLATVGKDLAMIAGGPAMPTGVFRVDPTTGTATRLSAEREDAAARIGAVPEHITFPTADDAVAHGLYYPPTSATHVGPDDERPPLVVLTHGGPTSAARTTINGTAQYWTSRGFAVVDVNYRGSIGYGRAYRDALRGNWGIHDVADTIAATRHLVAAGLADPDRLIIEGGSAGGYTTLLALCTTDTFAAGGSLFGVADLRALATDTHKFESRYLDSMVGPWPQDEQVYVDRSPITHVESLATPMIVLQGDEDAVVPPAQAELIVAALRRRGIPHAYILFEGEQHGFRKAANITRSLEARLAFYGRALGFDPADDIDLPEFDPGTRT